METSTYTVGEDCRKVREVPSRGGTMRKLVEGTAERLRHVCVLCQHGWGKMDNRKLEPVGLPRKKSQAGMGGCTLSWHHLHEHHLPLPRQGGTVAWAAPECHGGTSSDGVAEATVSTLSRSVVRPLLVHPATVRWLLLLGSAPLPCPGQATGAVQSRTR